MTTTQTGNIDPDTTNGLESTSKTDGDSGISQVKSTVQKDTATKPTDQDIVDRYFSKGYKRAKADINKEIKEAYGSDLDAILEDYKALKETGKTSKSEDSELAALKREHAKLAKELETVRPIVSQQEAKLREYQIQTPIREAVIKASPRKPEYQKVLEREIATRVRLDADGELTILTPDGKDAHQLTLDDLVSEVTAQYPDLVNQAPKPGHGSIPPTTRQGNPAVRGASTTGKDVSQRNAEIRTALQNIFGRSG